MQRVNIHLDQSVFTHDSRILKITESLARARVFDRIIVIARGNGELPTDETLDDIRTIHRLPALMWRLSKTLGMLEWLLRAMWKVWRLRPVCVNCHGLITLPVGVVVKRLTGARLIYEAHELETETAFLTGVRKRVYKLAELLLIRAADEVIVVGNAIAGWYKHQYGLTNVHVVRNAPKALVELEATPSILKQSLGIPPDEMVFLYHGNVGHGRGIELLLHAFANAPPGKHFVALGYGSMVPAVQRAAAASPQIHFHPAVPPAELLRWTAGADVGLCIIENVCLSYYYCLPNKLFEYIACGLPVVVSDFPEMSRVVNEAKCGWTVPADEAELQKLMNQITWDELQSKAESARANRLTYRWETEESTMLRLYGVADAESRELEAA